MNSIFWLGTKQLIGRHWLPIVFSFLCFYSLIGLLYGDVSFLSANGFRFVAVKGSYLLVFLLILIAIFRKALLLFLGEKSVSKSINAEAFWSHIFPFICIFGYFLMFIGDVVTRRFGFYTNGSRWEIVLLGLLFWFCWRMLQDRVLSFNSLVLPILFFVQAFIVVEFLKFTDGRVLFGDDHSSFLYRFQMLKDNFPAIPFYNTEWNAGYSAHEFYPSGMMNLFYLVLPFIYFIPDISTFEGSVAYNWLFPYVFLFLYPVSVYISVRLIKFDQFAALTSAIISILPSLGFLEWLMSYGTLGFCTSICLLPITFALTLRVVFGDELPNWNQVGALVIAISLFCRWSLTAVIILPIALAVVFYAKHIFVKDRLIKLVVCVFCLLVLNLPWAIRFYQDSKVSSFISGSSIPGSTATNFMSKYVKTENGVEYSNEFSYAHAQFRSLASKVNPLLWFFVVPGFFYIQEKRWKVIFASMLSWLFFLAVFGEVYKPQLELRRMILPASFLMTMLAGSGIAQSLRCFISFRASDFPFLRILSSVATVLLLGGVAISPFIAAHAYTSRSDEQFSLVKPIVKNLSKAISENGGTGRTFFSGFILHDLGATSYNAQNGGHIAPVAKFSKKPLYAFDYIHRLWGTVDPIPLSFRKRGEDGIEEFLNIINATAVVTHKREWVDYFSKRPWYKQVFQEGRFRVFVREKETGGYFYKGLGNIKTVKGGIEVVPQTTEVVVKYRYLTRLTVRNNLPGVEIFPVHAFDEERGPNKLEQVNYIGLKVSDEIVKNQTPVNIGFD